MSFSNNIAARGGLRGWFRAHGHNAGGISATGKIYLGSEGSNADHACRCGQDKKSSHLVCNTCWFSSPIDVRHQLKRGDVRARRAALRTILDYAGGRRVLRQLNQNFTGANGGNGGACRTGLSPLAPLPPVKS